TLSTMVVEEGAPVVDDDGDLVGICTTDGDHSVQVLTVDTMPGTSATTTTARVGTFDPMPGTSTRTPTAPRQPTSIPATSVPPATVPPTTSPPATPSTVAPTRPPTTPPQTATTQRSAPHI